MKKPENFNKVDNETIKFGNTEIEIAFKHGEYSCDINDKINTYLYRISQEALNNIIKHSRASEFTIQFISKTKDLVIIVSDDGNGFEIDKIMNGSITSFGLINHYAIYINHYLYSMESMRYPLHLQYPLHMQTYNMNHFH